MTFRGVFNYIVALGVSVVLLGSAALAQTHQETPRNIRASDSTDLNAVPILWDIHPGPICNLFGLCVTNVIYSVYRSSDDTIACDDPWLVGDRVVDTIARTNIGWTDTTAIPGKRYKYAIASWNLVTGFYCSLADGNFYDYGSRRLDSAPNATASTTQSSQITVSWGDYPSSYGVSYWRVFRSTNINDRCNPSTLLAETPNRSQHQYNDTSAAYNTNYYYSIQAKDANFRDSICSTGAATGLRPSFFVSGFVQNGATVSISGGGSCTAGSGVYNCVGIPYGATVVVTPSHPGYTFTPASRQYSNITTSHAGQDFSATINTYSISGAVRSGADVAITGGGSCSAASGAYVCSGIPYGVTVNITPTLAGYSFSPSSRQHANVTQNLTNQDFSSTLNTYSISGNCHRGTTHHHTGYRICILRCAKILIAKVRGNVCVAA